jgi:hypothetical protein
MLYAKMKFSKECNKGKKQSVQHRDKLEVGYPD